MTLDARDRLRVGRLDTGALAGTAGFRVGDEILAVNRVWVRSPLDLQSHLDAAIRADGRAWVYVNRNGVREWVNLDLAATSRGRVGANIDNLGLRFDARDRLRIGHLEAGALAGTAGFRVGDEILAVNRIWVRTPADFHSHLNAALHADGRAWVYVDRIGGPHWVNVDLAAAAGGSFGATVFDRGGLVTIADVTPRSVALAAGLREGDVVLAANGIPIETQAQLASEIRAAARTDGELVLDIRRNGRARTLHAYFDADANVAAGARLRR